MSSYPVIFGNSSDFEHTKSQLLQMSSPDASNGFIDVDESMIDTPARLARMKRQADLEANRRAANGQMLHDQPQGVGPVGGAQVDGQGPQAPQQHA